MVIPQAPHHWHSLWVPRLGDYPIWDYPVMICFILMVFGCAWIAYSKRPALPLCLLIVGMVISVGAYAKTRDMRLSYSYDLETVELSANMESVRGELGGLVNTGRKPRSWVY